MAGKRNIFIGISNKRKKSSPFDIFKPITTFFGKMTILCQKIVQDLVSGKQNLVDFLTSIPVTISEGIATLIANNPQKIFILKISSAWLLIPFFKQLKVELQGLSFKQLQIKSSEVGTAIDYQKIYKYYVLTAKDVTKPAIEFLFAKTHRMKYVETIILDNIKPKKVKLPFFAKYDDIKFLKISYNKINFLPFKLTKFTDVKSLFLENIHFQINQLPPLQNIICLSLSKCNLNDYTISNIIDKFTQDRSCSLLYLDLSDNIVHKKETIEKILAISSLKYLKLPKLYTYNWLPLPNFLNGPNWLLSTLIDKAIEVPLNIIEYLLQIVPIINLANPILKIPIVLTRKTFDLAKTTIGKNNIDDNKGLAKCLIQHRDKNSPPKLTLIHTGINIEEFSKSTFWTYDKKKMISQYKSQKITLNEKNNNAFSGIKIAEAFIKNAFDSSVPIIEIYKADNWDSQG